MTNATSVIVKNYYGYTPNLGAAIFFGIFFALIAIGQVRKFIQYPKLRYFSQILVIGTLMEMVGFLIRIPTVNDPASMGTFVPSLLCILLAPTVLAAADYAIVAHLMILGNVKAFGVLTPNFVRYAFLITDIAAFFVQAMGGGVQATGNADLVTFGSRCVLAGLSLSLTVFVLFGALSVYLLRAIRHRGGRQPWQRIFYVMFFDMLMLTLRSCYRVAEYADMKYQSAIATNETLFYVLDVVPMTLLLLVWLPWHAGHFKLDEVIVPSDDACAQPATASSIVTNAV